MNEQETRGFKRNPNREVKEIQAQASLSLTSLSLPLPSTITTQEPSPFPFVHPIAFVCSSIHRSPFFSLSLLNFPHMLKDFPLPSPFLLSLSLNASFSLSLCSHQRYCFLSFLSLSFFCSFFFVPFSFSFVVFFQKKSQTSTSTRTSEDQS